MKSLRVEVIRDGNIEICRDLCNELMAFQKSKAVIAPEAFDGMNFDTRMKTSFNSAVDSYVAVAKDGGEAVGYIFSTVEGVEAKDAALPAWVPQMPGKEMLGFYPKWDRLPDRAGCVSNLYFREEYRGLGVGRRLMDMSMDWFGGIPGLDLIFIYISNGNGAALDFYLRYGFTFSHDVFGGFIKAVYKKI